MQRFLRAGKNIPLLVGREEDLRGCPVLTFAHLFFGLKYVQQFSASELQCQVQLCNRLQSFSTGKCSCTPEILCSFALVLQLCRTWCSKTSVLQCSVL